MRPALPKRRKALLLDDDPATLRLLGRALAERGVAVLAASEGAGGLALMLDELLDLDVLIVDLALPGRDAWAMLRLIRGLGGEEDLAVVVLAERPCAGVRGRLLSLGADEVVDRADGPEAAARAALAAAASRREGSPRRSRPAARPLSEVGRVSLLPALPALGLANVSPVP